MNHSVEFEMIVIAYKLKVQKDVRTRGPSNRELAIADTMKYRQKIQSHFQIIVRIPGKGIAQRTCGSRNVYDIHMTVN